jgi:hypothetical protein
LGIVGAVPPQNRHNLGFAQVAADPTFEIHFGFGFQCGFFYAKPLDGDVAVAAKAGRCIMTLEVERLPRPARAGQRECYHCLAIYADEKGQN